MSAATRMYTLEHRTAVQQPYWRPADSLHYSTICCDDSENILPVITSIAVRRNPKRQSTVVRSGRWAGCFKVKLEGYCCRSTWSRPTFCECLSSSCAARSRGFSILEAASIFTKGCDFVGSCSTRSIQPSYDQVRENESRSPSTTKSMPKQPNIAHSSASHTALSSHRLVSLAVSQNNLAAGSTLRQRMDGVDGLDRLHTTPGD